MLNTNTLEEDSYPFKSRNYFLFIKQVCANEKTYNKTPFLHHFYPGNQLCYHRPNHVGCTMIDRDMCIHLGRTYF